MKKSKFDPNKPFTVVDSVSQRSAAPKRKFNPEEDYEVVEERPLINQAAEVAQDAAVAGLQGATAGFSDEIIGAGSAAYKKATGDTRPYEAIYEEARNAVRELQQTGQARSPIISFIADLGGGVVNPAGKVIKGAGMVSRMARGVMAPKSVGQAIVSGGVQGAGYSDLEGEEAVPQIALGAALGGATKGVGDFISSKFDKPDAIRASALGANKKAFKVKGPQKREAVVKTLKELGFYDTAPRSWDPTKRKFIAATKSADSEGLDLPDRFMERAMDGIDKLSQENNLILSTVQVPPQIVNDAVDKTVQSSKRGTLPGTSQQDATEFLNNWVAENLPAGAVSAPALEQLKRNIQEELSSAYRNIGATDVKMAARKEVLMDLASNIKQALENVAPSPKYAENNKIMSALFTQKGDLEDLIAKESAGSGKGFRGLYETVTSVVDQATGGKSREMARASTGDLLNRYANLAKILGASAQQAPQKAAFNQMSVENQNRSPDSVTQDATSYNFKRVKSLMTQPLPRSSEELINNAAAKQLLISKAYHMVGPEAASILERQFEIFQPAQMKPALQKFMTDNPSLFTMDDYNRVDGIITDDLMIQKAISDIRKNSEMDSVKKARTINAVLNRKPEVRW